MGRGTIVSGGTDGLYTVDLDYGSTRADQLIDYLQTAITDIDVAIAAAESVAESASLSLSSVLSALNGAIVTYTGDESSENKEALQEATEAAAEAEVAKEKATVKVSGLKYQKMALESRLSAIQAIDVTERTDVWCVDLTEDASGSVATIEVNGEGGQGILIAPEGRSPNDGDGYMTAREVQSAEQAFYNAAILPGWQKYAPTYRTGTISNIDYDNDTCTVTLDAAASTAQSLDINQATVLSGVDVEYMSCNAGAFEDGDKVVVQFVGQSWSSPKVIGFVSNPKACGPAYIAFYVDLNDDETYDTGNGPSVYLGDVTSSSTTYPTAGMTRTAYSNGTTRYDLGTANSRVFIAYPRIRFDVAWVKPKASDTYFEEDHITLYREQTYDKSVTADIDIGAITSFYTTLIFGTSSTYVRRDYELVSGTDFDDSPTNLMSGSGVSESFGMSGDPGVPGAPYVVADYAEATAYHLNFYDVPNTINVRKIGDPEVYLEYTLESFGPPCELYDGTQNYDIYRNPDDLGEGTTTKKPYNMPMAIYKRATGS